MAIRSTTGCYTCKTRRKKCDETHPRCQKCIKLGIACSGYEYINSKAGKLRTKPAPKSTSGTAASVGQTSAPAYSWSATASITTNQGRLDSNNALQFFRTRPLGLSSLTESCDSVARVPFPQDTDRRPQVLPITRLNPRALQTRLPIYGPIIGHETLSQSYFPAPMPPQDVERLNPDQASLYHALFSLGRTQSDPSPSDCFQSSLDPEASDEGKDDNREGIRQIWVSTPVMDRSVTSNLLPFVLQSYSNWMTLIAFDPSQSACGTKDLLVRQLADSGRARGRIKLISEAMRVICETGSANPQAAKSVSLLVSNVHETVLSYNARPPELIPDLDRQNASKELDNVLEIIGLQIHTNPLHSSLALMESIAPIFRRACPEPLNTLADLCDILLGPELNLRNFAATDVAFSVAIGRPMLFRYKVEFSIELCERMKSHDRNFGLQWLHGVPDQFIVLIAWLSRLKEDSEATGQPVKEETVAQIEEDIQKLEIFTTENNSEDPTRLVGRLVVQGCWRQAVYVFLYMAVCGATAQDPRVEKAHQAFMRLVNGVTPGRSPDAFLAAAWCTIGVATTEECDRDTLRRRLYALPECANPGTCGSDGIQMLEDIWKRTESEGRPAVWNDKRIACYRVSGM